ncbi:OTU domain-containing protein 4 [Acipenser ruthenus]|uniref:OTU domain-containing protein 4 n=1 Tax=Acipenser ruthenus TaxID=7906 RepID=A0A444UUZ9_ACIRT|nr:OTU domain-containing protein 4 [Acipenser ruthenus]
MFMAVAHSRGQSGLPPRLQHNIPSGRSSSIHNPPGSTNMAPYKQYQPHPSSQRAGRGYGPPSRSRQQMPCVNKECQFTFVPDNGEEPQGLDGTITFYELEEGDETAFPPLPGQGVSPPLAPPPATFWLRREPSPSGKQAMASSEEDMDERSNSGEYPEDYIYTDPEAGFQSPSVYAAAESTTNLVLVNSSVNSLSCVNAASATVFTSGSTASSQSPAAPPQSTVQPVIVSPHPVTRPDYKVVQYYFNMGVQETAGQVEIKALSLMYKRRFIVYRHPGKPPTEVADEDYKEKVVLSLFQQGLSRFGPVVP